MRNKLILLTLITTGFYFCCETSKSSIATVKTESEKLDTTKAKKYKMLGLDSEFRYTNSTGDQVIIQNSLPKAGAEMDGVRGYYDFSGTHYGCGFFVTRVINETTAPLDLLINFSGELSSILQPPAAYYKLFIPPDTMTMEKLSLFNFGITELKSFLDTTFNKPTSFYRTVNPHEESLFLVGFLSHYVPQLNDPIFGVPTQGGPIRAGVTSKEQELFYIVSIGSLGSDSIPCGQFIFKN